MLQPENFHLMACALDQYRGYELEAIRLAQSTSRNIYPAARFAIRQPRTHLAQLVTADAEYFLDGTKGHAPNQMNRAILCHV
jgi:hypothetical protein